MRKIAKRQITILVLMHGNCGIVKSKYKMKIMTQELELSASIDKVKKSNKGAEKKNKEAQGEDHRLKATEEMKNLELNLRDVNKITNKEISALLFVCYGKPTNCKKSVKGNRNLDLVNILTAKLNKYIIPYTRYVDEITFTAEREAGIEVKQVTDV